MSDPRHNGANPPRPPGEVSDHGRVPVLDPAFARRWTVLAAATVHADAEKLITLAESRGTIPNPERRVSREILEHLADARNLICAWALDIVEHAGNDELTGEVTEAICQTLAATALAFDHADRARALALEHLGARR